MAKLKLNTPASSAGIMRFNDVKVSDFQLDPNTVIAIAVGIIVLISLTRLIFGN